jgi:hypothetical protein
MKKIGVIGIALVAIVVSSCAINYGNRSQRIYNQTIVTTPMLADVDVNLNKKVEGTSTQKGISLAKEGALNDAMLKSGADLIVSPIFDVKKVSFSRYTVDVTGFYGKYKAIRSLDIADTTLLRYSNGNMNSKDVAKPKFKFFRKK